MKLNWAERWVVNNPSRVFQQKAEIHLLKKMKDLNAESTVMEVGCGRGVGAELILSRFQPRHLHAVDLDVEMIQKAGARLSSSATQAVSLYVADITCIPFKNETQDAVFGFGVLHHIPNWRAAIFEIARVLKKDGIYYLEEFYPPLYQNFITKRILLHPEKDRFFGLDLKSALADAQLSLERAVECKKLGILGVAVKS